MPDAPAPTRQPRRLQMHASTPELCGAEDGTQGLVYVKQELY